MMKNGLKMAIKMLLILMTPTFWCNGGGGHCGMLKW